MINLVISNLLINPNNSLVYTRNGVNMQAKYLLSSPPELTSASDNKLRFTLLSGHMQIIPCQFRMLKSFRFLQKRNEV